MAGSFCGCGSSEDVKHITKIPMLTARDNTLMNEDQIVIYQILEGIKLAARVDHNCRGAYWRTEQKKGNDNKTSSRSKASNFSRLGSIINETQKDDGVKEGIEMIERGKDDDIHISDLYSIEPKDKVLANKPLLVRKFKLSNPSRTKGKELPMKDYASNVFGEIRRKENVSTDAYISAWSYKPEDIQIPDTGAGRSGSLFLFSRDRRFLFKTIPKHEVETLKDIIYDYAKHITLNSDSRLMRFFALHRFTIGKNDVYIVVANNIFYSSTGLRLHHKFDLKGRKIKSSTCCWSKAPPLQPAKGAIFKDNQLDREFYPEDGETLLETLNKDSQFLRKQLCIDYSLLIGVHEPPGSSMHESESGRLQKLNKLADEEAENLRRVSSQYQTPDVPLDNFMPARRFSITDTGENIHEGIASIILIDEKNNDNNQTPREIYFVGVIDFLSRYFLKKKTANFFKTFLWHEDTLSTISPEKYCFRWQKYLPSVIRTRRPDSDNIPNVNDEDDDDDGISFHVQIHVDEHGGDDNYDDNMNDNVNKSIKGIANHTIQDEDDDDNDETATTEQIRIHI